MITEEQKNELNALISDVDAEKHYWFFRTMQGTLYDEFVNEGYIAIGYDEIVMQDLRDLPNNEYEAKDMLKIKLRAHHEDFNPAHIGKAAGQILRFYREMAIGDIVIIPNEQSKTFAFGKVQSALYEDSSYHDVEACQFVKRRKVKWLKRLTRSQLDPKFLLGLGNQQTMSCIDNYAEFVDRKIQPLYTKGDKTYLVLRVNQDKGLSWDDFCFIADLGELFKGVSNSNGLNVDLSSIEMKINVQSPGDILMICPEGMGYLLPLAAIVIGCVALPGGTVKFWGIEIQTHGIGTFVQQIVNAVNAYLDHKEERRIRLQERLQNMKIEQVTAPDQIECEETVSPEVLPSSEDDSAHKE